MRVRASSCRRSSLSTISAELGGPAGAGGAVGRVVAGAGAMGRRCEGFSGAQGRRPVFHSCIVMLPGAGVGPWLRSAPCAAASREPRSNADSRAGGPAKRTSTRGLAARRRHRWHRATGPQMPHALSTPMPKQMKAIVTSSPSTIVLLEGDEAGGAEGGVEGAASVMAPSERTAERAARPRPSANGARARVLERTKCGHTR